MKIAELLNETYLTEGQHSEVETFITTFVPLLLEDDIPEPIDGSPVSQPSILGSSSPAPGAPNDPGPHGHSHNDIANLWFRTLVGQLWWLTSAKRVKKRLKQVGVSGEASKRITNSIAIAQKNIGLLFKNPGWRPAPQFTIEPGKAPKPLNKSYMQPFKLKASKLITQELRKIPGKIILEGLQAQRDADAFTSLVRAKLKPLGFHKDRDIYKDSNGNVIELQIDLEDQMINWSIGKLRGRRTNWAESGNDPLSDSRSVLAIVMQFAQKATKE